MGNEYSWQTAPVSAGVNNTLPDFSIDDAELSLCTNYQPDHTGQGWLIKRDGLTKTDTNQRTATTFSIYGGLLANYYHNGTVVYNFAGTSVATGMAAAYDSWTTMAGYDMFANGTNAQKTSNGTSFSAISNIPAGTKYIAAANNFLYAAGHDAGKVRWADYATLETWPAVNELNVIDGIVGLRKHDNALGIWAGKSFYILMGYTNTNQEIAYYSEKDGCTGSNRSITTTPYGTFWWSRSGIVWMTEGFKLDYPMHRKLSATLNNLNRAYDGYVHSCWDSREQCVKFWVFYGAAQTTVNRRIDFYPRYDAFYEHTGAGVAMSASGAAMVSGAESVYVGGYNPTYLYKQSGLTDDGTAITGTVETKREGTPLVQRTGRTVIVSTGLTGAEDVTMGYYIDTSSSISPTRTAAVASGQQHTLIAENLRNYMLKYHVSDAATATRTKLLRISHTGTRDALR